MGLIRSVLKNSVLKELKKSLTIFHVPNSLGSEDFNILPVSTKKRQPHFTTGSYVELSSKLTLNSDKIFISNISIPSCVSINIGTMVMKPNNQQNISRFQ